VIVFNEFMKIIDTMSITLLGLIGALTLPIGAHRAGEYHAGVGDAANAAC
jgi:hypothetical protein